MLWSWLFLRSGPLLALVERRWRLREQMPIRKTWSRAGGVAFLLESFLAIEPVSSATSRRYPARAPRKNTGLEIQPGLAVRAPESGGPRNLRRLGQFLGNDRESRQLRGAERSGNC